MANWQRGVIHLRGSKQSLTKFILNLIDPDDLEAANVNENSIYLKTTSHVGFGIKGVSGGYLDGYEVNINFSDETVNENGCYTFKMDFSSCGDLDVTDMCSVSQLYNVDFAIEVCDVWTGITQDVCIINGNIIRNNVVRDA